MGWITKLFGGKKVSPVVHVSLVESDYGVIPPEEEPIGEPTSLLIALLEDDGVEWDIKSEFHVESIKRSVATSKYALRFVVGNCGLNRPYTLVEPFVVDSNETERKALAKAVYHRFLREDKKRFDRGLKEQREAQQALIEQLKHYRKGE